ncbi:MAG: glycosyltransferase family 2 protein [Lachnospiraceae bacterium]|nr:glycosyltransferase family 2 protein [Lachnospiraceae bacterium]
MISIIVPLYNKSSVVARTLASISAQTYTDWEALIMDDASTDDSLQAARKWIQTSAHPEKFRLIALGKNGGVAGARNRGMEEARGRYLAFLDADDIWLPQKLERTLSFLQEKEAAFVYTGYVFARENKIEEIGLPIREEALEGLSRTHAVAELDFKHALSRTIIFTSTVMLDRTKIPKSLLQMPQMESEDTATWWRILKSGISAYGLDEVLALYARPERHASSLSSNKGKAILRIWKLYGLRRWRGCPFRRPVALCAAGRFGRRCAESEGCRQGNPLPPGAWKQRKEGSLQTGARTALEKPE